MESYNNQRTAAKTIYRGTRIVWLIVSIIEILLLFRFLLKLLRANPFAAFTSIIYSITQPLVAPFLNVFSSNQIEGNIVEWQSLLAITVYWLIGWAIIKLFLTGKPISIAQAARQLNKEDKNI